MADQANAISAVDVLRARKRLSFELAEAVDLHFKLSNHNTNYDVDEAAKIIGIYLPLTYIEADAELEKMKDESEVKPLPKTPSVFEQLRQALGLDNKISMIEVMKAATERIEQSKIHLSETQSGLA